jgi:NNP family nitrate/nitrite transporter-like MFS transporter
VRQAGSGSTSTIADLLQTLKSVSTSAPIWAIGIFHGFSYGTLSNLGQWLPSILADMDGRGDVTAWSLGTGIVLLIGTLGRAFGGILLRWYSRSVVTNVTVLLIAILYIALGLTGNPLVGLGVGIILAWLGGSNYGSIFSLTGQTVSPAYLATAVGFMNLIGNITNVLLTVILGTVREFTGSFSMTLCATGLVALCAWAVGHRIVRRIDNQT